MDALDMQTTSFRSAFHGFLRNDRASISIEFAILMPIFLFLVTGGLGYWEAFHSNSHTARIAYAISDIMSRYDVVDNTDMANLYGVQDKMISPNLDQRRLRVSSICFEDGEYRVLWSYTASSADVPTQAPLQDDQIPLELLPPMEPQDSIILTEVAARWHPHFLNVGLASKTWRTALIARPRFVKIIPHATLNPSNICPDDS
jgi:Flp pilus assembly protein TadG